MPGCITCEIDNGYTDSKPKGCKSNGNCGTEGCNKLNSFDWLMDMEDHAFAPFDVFEVRFKNGRKEFFRNQNQLELYNGDAVVVEVPNGHHLGYITLSGELVRLQMKKKGIDNGDADVKSIYRVATEKDLNKFNDLKKKESVILFRTREIIDSLKLEMKLTDIEYQADGTKATFYYSADERVDFRELIKVLASEFKIRVEMRQISLRQEASRLGGIGSCGRELCCSTWLTEFKSVSTSAARYQNLSLNPGKLSGQCGRLKCCLNYELETYMDALKDIPQLEGPLLTQKGEATLQKTDIFKKIMWFGYASENTWIPIAASRVKEIQEQNKKGNKPASLKEDDVEVNDETIDTLNSDLEALDKKFSSPAKKKKKKKKRRNPRQFRRNKPNNNNNAS